jgi:hypothetical protein
MKKLIYVDLNAIVSLYMSLAVFTFMDVFLEVVLWIFHSMLSAEYYFDGYISTVFLNLRHLRFSYVSVN